MCTNKQFALPHMLAEMLRRERYGREKTATLLVYSLYCSSAITSLIYRKEKSLIDGKVMRPETVGTRTPPRSQ